MRTRSRKNLLLIMLVCGYIFSGCGSTNILPKPSSGHQPKLATPFISVLWSLKDIYTMQSSPKLSSDVGMACFIGAMQPVSETLGVHCLDGLTGQELWSIDSNPCMHLVLGSDGLYVGCSGNTYVVKYDLNGDKLWLTPLRGPGITFMYLVGDQLQVLTTLDELVGLNTSDGKGTLLHSDDQIAILSTPAVSYVDMNGLQAIDNNTKTVLWHIKLDGTLELDPVFPADMILLRTGVVMGRMYGIGRASGDILWRTDNNIISNIAYSPTKATAYVLSRDGKLLAITRDSGEQSILAEFSPVPFILNGEEIVGGYDLAFDDSTQILYELLGDSRQLFAFQMR